MEIYFGVEDLFAPIYSPSAGKTVDIFTGEELETAAGLNIISSIPTPSFGFSISF